MIALLRWITREDPRPDWVTSHPALSRAGTPIHSRINESLLYRVLAHPARHQEPVASSVEWCAGAREW